MKLVFTAYSPYWYMIPVYAYLSVHTCLFLNSPSHVPQRLLRTCASPLSYLQRDLRPDPLVQAIFETPLLETS